MYSWKNGNKEKKHCNAYVQLKKRKQGEKKHFNAYVQLKKRKQGKKAL